MKKVDETDMVPVTYIKTIALLKIIYLILIKIFIILILNSFSQLSVFPSFYRKISPRVNVTEILFKERHLTYERMLNKLNK